jgi:hypothetical protein
LSTYVFDTNSFIVLGHYFPERFPSFWGQFEKAVTSGQIVSVREVFNELDGHGNRPHLKKWVKTHRRVFLAPTPEETAFLAQLFAVPRYRQMVSEKQRMKGTPVADPFVIAHASVNDAWVVTEEAKKKNSAKIPNVCEQFGVSCTNIEGFMRREGWRF